MSLTFNFISIFFRSAAYAIINRLKQPVLNDSILSSDSVTIDDDDMFFIKIRIHGAVEKYEIKKVFIWFFF